MGRPRKKRKKNPLDGRPPRNELSLQQKQCIELMMTSRMTNAQLADRVGVSHTTISNWKNNVPVFMNEYDKAVRANIKSLAGDAFQTMRDLLTYPDPDVRFKAAKDILDRGGYKASEKLEITVKKKLEDFLLDEDISASFIEDIEYEMREDVLELESPEEEDDDGED